MGLYHLTNNDHEIIRGVASQISGNPIRRSERPEPTNELVEMATNKIVREVRSRRGRSSRTHPEDVRNAIISFLNPQNVVTSPIKN